MTPVIYFWLVLTHHHSGASIIDRAFRFTDAAACAASVKAARIEVPNGAENEAIAIAVCVEGDAEGPICTAQYLGNFKYCRVGVKP